MVSKVSKSILISAKNGDKLALEELVNKNIKYIYWVAHKFCSKNNFEDLVSEGKIGFLKALKKYNIESSSEFLAYAYPYIKGEILNYINKNIFCVHMSDSQIRNYLKLKKQSGNLKEFINFKSESIIPIDNMRDILHARDSMEDINKKIDSNIFWKDLSNKYNLSFTEVYILKKFYVDMLSIREISKLLHMKKSQIANVKKLALTKLRTMITTQNSNYYLVAEGGD